MSASESPGEQCEAAPQRYPIFDADKHKLGDEAVTAEPRRRLYTLP